MKVWPFIICLTTTSLAVAGGMEPLTLASVERMTPVQIERLNANQVDALLLEADRSAQRFLDATLRGPLSGPVWPSADYTLYYAANLSYDSWDTSDYKKSPGADLTSDGCSFPVAAAYKKVFGASACRHHNYAYRNVAQYRQTHNEAVRRVLDLRFLADMHLQCLNDSTSRAGEHACNLAAVAAYVQARRLGADAFNRVQARYSNP